MQQHNQTGKRAVGALLAAAVAAVSLAFTSTVSAQQAPAPVWRTDVTGSFTQALSLMNLVPGGQARSIKLIGLNNVQYFDFGVRADEVVSEARLELAYTPSPVVLPKVSQINFYLNGELQQSIPLADGTAGKPSQLSVQLNPKAIRAQNQISVEFVGHYQTVCENPANPAMWLDIGPSSSLMLVKQRVRVSNDIGRFPAPFVDTASGAPTELPMVFAKAPTAGQKQAAAIFASLVGRETAWRGANFPVHYNTLPSEGHFVVFVTNNERPDFLKDYPQVQGPQVSMMDAPMSVAAKMLVIAGRDEADLVTAAKALTVDSLVLIGETFRVKNFKDPEKRKAYAAPNWIDTESTVPFARLIQYPGQLSARGYNMPPVHVPLRLAPDLFMVDDATLGMQIRYRYTKPMTGESAQLRTYVNGSLVDSENLAARDGRGSRQIVLPGFYGAIAGSSATSLAMTAVNDLSFAVDYERIIDGGSEKNCKSVSLVAHQMEIEPGSTLQIKGLYHYAKLPDLKLFTQSGFPFTKYADLSQTTVLIDDAASESEVTTMLNTIARMASVTGAAATFVKVADQADKASLKGQDVLVVGRMKQLLTDLDADKAAALQTKVVSALQAPDTTAALAQGESMFADASLAAIVSAESPFDSGRTMVALLTEGAAGSALLNTKLVNPAELAAAGGAVTVLNEREIREFNVGSTFTSGNLPWYHKVWMSLTKHPVLLVIFALFSAITVGLGIFYFMRTWVRSRRQ